MLVDEIYGIFSKPASKIDLSLNISEVISNLFWRWGVWWKCKVPNRMLSFLLCCCCCCFYCGVIVIIKVVKGIEGQCVFVQASCLSFEQFRYSLVFRIMIVWSAWVPNSSHLTELSWGLNGIMHVRCLA